MINKVILHKTNKEIIVDDIKECYSRRNTLLINNTYKLKKLDKVQITCNNCGKEEETLFLFKEKLFNNKNIICSTCSRERSNYNKYGDKYPNSFGKEKMKVIIKNKYGVDNISQLDEIKKIISIKNSNQSKKTIDKRKNTMMAKYGVDSSLKLNKTKNNLNRFQNDNIRKTKAMNKKKMNNKIKYGVEFPLQLAEFKENFKNTCISKYGVDHPFKSSIVTDKIKQTNLNRYGVEYVLQNQTMFNKVHSASSKSMGVKTINENLHYQTKPELECINYCRSKGIKIKDGPSIPYIFENKKHVYHIDFETDKYIIEIKGNHGWYKQNLASGKIDAKNTAGVKYASLINKEFLFLLEVKDYSKFI